MINRILHSCSCIIECIKLVAEEIKCSTRLLFYLFCSTRLINSIKHQHACQILYLLVSFVNQNFVLLFNGVLEFDIQSIHDENANSTVRPEFFYYLIYGIFFSDLGLWVRKQINKKALKMTSHFQSFFFFYFQIFFLYLQIIGKPIVCVKSLNKMDRAITFSSVTLKNTQTEPQKYIIFFNETNNI